jgi:branched-chain amino acid transport system ATP-binding protein
MPDSAPELGPRAIASRQILADVPRLAGVRKPDPIVVADGIIRRFGGLTAVDVERVEI